MSNTKYVSIWDLKPDSILLDLRKTSAFSHGHIPGSISFWQIWEAKGFDPLERNVMPDESCLAACLSSFPEGQEIVLIDAKAGYLAKWFWDKLRLAKYTYIYRSGYAGYRRWVNTVFGQEFNLVALHGKTGSGKTSLLKTILGQQKLTSGTIELLGGPVRQGLRQLGYIPQQKLLDRGTPMRARDLVELGVNGHRWGPPVSSAAVKARVNEVLESVGATAYANVPVSTLSGGEQQRLRVGQAIAAEPKLLLCDEPLLSLDLHHQRNVSELINAQRTALGTAVIFVTHDVNPILPYVDRVLYLAGGKFRMGTPDEVLRSDVLTAMYGTPVDVIRSHGRVAVLGTPDVFGGGHDPIGDHHELAGGVV